MAGDNQFSLPHLETPVGTHDEQPSALWNAGYLSATVDRQTGGRDGNVQQIGFVGDCINRCIDRIVGPAPTIMLGAFLGVPVETSMKAWSESAGYEKSNKGKE